MSSNDEYIDKSSARVIQLFNNRCLRRYPCTQKSVVDIGLEFKRDFTPFLDYFDIKPVLTTNKKPQANAPSERVHQVILNMIVAKDLSNKVFDYIDP